MCEYCRRIHEQCMNSVFVPYTVKSCDNTVHAQKKKIKKKKNKNLKTQNVDATFSGIQKGTKWVDLL